jgi:hypothetical protein
MIREAAAFSSAVRVSPVGQYLQSAVVRKRRRRRRRGRVG